MFDFPFADRFLIGLIILTWDGCAPSSSKRELPVIAADASELEKLLGGQLGITVIQNATQVRVYRVKPIDESYERLTQYTMTAGPVELPVEDITLLRSAVLSHDTYLWNVAKACGPPVYGVRYEFEHDGHCVDVMVCYLCDYLGIYYDGQLIQYEDCDHGRSALVAVARAAFPNDPDIQSLP